MSALRVVALALLGALCVVEARALVGGGAPGLVVTPSDTRVAAVPAAPPADVEPAFLAHMTADDVARGVYGLAAERGAVALTDAQRAQIRPLLEDGAALRAKLGELRMARRAAREAWLADGAALVEVVGAERLRGTR